MATAFSTAKARLEIDDGTVTALTGSQFDLTAGSKTVTGTGSAFDTELILGDHITVNSESRIVETISSATVLTVHKAFDATAAPATADAKDMIQVPTVSDATGPDSQAEQIPIPTWDTDGAIEQISGNRNPGTFQFTAFLRLKLGAHAQLLADHKSGVLRAWRAWIPDSNTIATNPPPHVSNSRISFEASVSGVSTAMPTGAAITAQITLLISGEQVYAAGVDA